MSTVKAMTITVDSLLPRPKLDCDWGYDVAVKGLSVVVILFLEHLLTILVPKKCVHDRSYMHCRGVTK